MTDFPLLHDPDELEITDSWYCRIPVIGWMIGGSRQYRNERRLVNQAVERGPVPPDAWEDRPHDPTIRDKISRIVIDKAYPKATCFHPDDPIELMMVLRYGDLNECEIMMDIEDAYPAVKFTDELVGRLVEGKMTFIQFIQFIQGAQEG